MLILKLLRFKFFGYKKYVFFVLYDIRHKSLKFAKLLLKKHLNLVLKENCFSN